MKKLNNDFVLDMHRSLKGMNGPHFCNLIYNLGYNVSDKSSFLDIGTHAEM